MRSSSSGFLLLLVGILAAVGFLSGQLDRWMAFLFQPPGTPLPAATSSSTPAPPATVGLVAPGAGGSQVLASAPGSTGNRRATAASA